jgi:predicted lipoprotein
MKFRPFILAVLIAGLSAPFGGCRLVKNEDGTGNSGTTATQADKKSKLDAMAEDMWQSRILPHLETQAVDLATLAPKIRADLQAAGKEHGYRAGGEGTPWSFSTRFSGRIVSAKTDTRAATADVDVTGDGEADATIQLGPVIQGTALRDTMPFIVFTDFTDQIEFASFSRSLNTYAYEQTLAEFPGENLIGKDIAVLGAFTMRGPGEQIRITPVSIKTAGAQ